MGALRGEDGVVRPLRGDTLVGRGERCDVRLGDPRVSTEHARLRWVDGGWRLRDLGSRNGTWVDGVRLEPGAEIGVGAGSVIGFVGVTFGVDAAPPAPFAETEDGVVGGDGDALFLGERAVVYRDGDGWALDLDGEVGPIADGAVVDVAGARFRLSLPGVIAATLDAESAVDLDDVVLVFDDGLVCETPAGARRLKPAAAHQLLLTLAKERVYDAAEGLAAGEQGWVEVADVCRWLDAHENRVNVDVFRLRKQLAEVGIVGAARVVERRPQQRRMRIGLAAERLKIA